jgi:hypothetical protein
VHVALNSFQNIAVVDLLVAFEGGVVVAVDEGIRLVFVVVAITLIPSPLEICLSVGLCTNCR